MELVLKIEDSVVVVTGAARGLGLEITNHLLGLGAVCVAVDIDSSALSRMADSVHTEHCDVTNVDSVNSAIKSIVDRHGRIDGLVNNAGVIHSQPFVNILSVNSMMHDYESYRKCMAVNLDSVFIVTAAVVKEMVMRRTKGVVINVSSISAIGNEGQTAYSAAKGAVNALTVAWSKELPRFGIRCNAIAPGFIDTVSTSDSLHESIVRHLKESTPLRRLGKASEVAEAVEALIINEFINGAILPVDGGLRI
jgi:3-oxoacyl-[acyl-carrier protein] reductase